MGQAQAKDKEAEPKKRLTIPMLLPSESGNKIDGSDNDEGGVNDGRTGRAVPIPIPNLPAGLEQTIVETAASAPAELKWDQPSQVEHIRTTSNEYYGDSEGSRGGTPLIGKLLFSNSRPKVKLIKAHRRESAKCPDGTSEGEDDELHGPREMYSNSSSDWRSDGERGDDGDLLALQGYDDGSHKWFSSFPLVDYSGMVTFQYTAASNCQTVFLSGSFNYWNETAIVMKRIGGSVFQVKVQLQPGYHEYRYLCDGEWATDPHCPMIPNGIGAEHGHNNFIEIAADVVPPKKQLTEAYQIIESLKAQGRSSPPGDYSNEMPDLRDAKMPPQMPPHLLQATLNSQPLENDPSILPPPNHVVLNHMYALSVVDNVMIIGSTTRFDEKYVTTVMHKPFGATINK